MHRQHLKRLLYFFPAGYANCQSKPCFLYTSIDRNVSQLQAVHQLGIRNLIHSGSCIDTCDPQLTHVALQILTVIICIFERVHNLLMSSLIQNVLCTIVSSVSYTHLDVYKRQE